MEYYQTLRDNNFTKREYMCLYYSFTYYEKYYII